MAQEEWVSDVILGDEEPSSYRVLGELNPDVICLGYDQQALRADLEVWMRGPGQKIPMYFLEPYHPETFHNSFFDGAGQRHISHDLSQIPTRGGRTMTHYLVVAHQTATSPELLQCVSELAADDPATVFTVLVPATPVVHLLTWEEGETNQIARHRAEEARERFESYGLNVAQTKVGDGSPLLAIGDELRSHPGEYDAVVLSTLPLGLSRWLRFDVHHQAERKFRIPVIHVEAQRQVKANV